MSKSPRSKSQAGDVSLRGEKVGRVDTLKLWGSRAGAAGWLDAHAETAGEPVCVRTILNDNGWQIGEEWAVLTAAGYVPGENEKGRDEPRA